MREMTTNDAVSLELEKVLERCEGRSLERKYGSIQAAYSDLYKITISQAKRLAEAVRLFVLIAEKAQIAQMCDISAKVDPELGREVFKILPDIKAFLSHQPTGYVVIEKEVILEGK